MKAQDWVKILTCVVLAAMLAFIKLLLYDLSWWWVLTPMFTAICIFLMAIQKAGWTVKTKMRKRLTDAGIKDARKKYRWKKNR